MKVKVDVCATGTVPEVLTVVRVIPLAAVEAVMAVAAASVPVVVKLAVEPLPPIVRAP